MTTLTFSPARGDTLLRSTKPTIEPAAGLTGLLRASALLVTTLSAGGKASDFELLRHRCKELVEAFETALTQHGYSHDVGDDAIVALCALLDETALRHLDPVNKNKWIAEPIQVERLQHHNAGEYVFERMAIRMREAAPSIDLLECYAAILGLGFRGRYALEDETKRNALITSLNAQVEQLRPSQQPVFLIEHGGRRLGSWFQRLSPWGIAGLCAVVALAVWFAWHVALDAQLVSTIPSGIKR
ncbi:DotU family type IV/VI secretion system protein [Caballeronia sp. LZ001]|uniref:DotU family type IV/VI secretion system protein n=1 Tax=Caballeronia sp. LZ001 TaxID=3038553 RepID=UPI002854A52E|nr:DotU/TssL family secretion system protein [Caballeronia sp. LZ001]MDR5799553.1 DotU/TssL family secretion system protein [Caballeronia sp. LZ001]